MNEKKANSDALTSSNPSGPISRSPLEDAQLVRLREVLSMEYWHFGPGSAGFDGFSQGVCFLGGIYPDDSHASPVYALRFLPDALKSYGFSHMPAPVDIGDLRAAVTESLNYLRGIPVNGLTAVKIAITAASKAGARLPWLAVAASDLECARCLPIELRSDDEIRNKIRDLGRKSGGEARAAKNKKTQLINTKVWKEFVELRSDGFSEDLLTRFGKPVPKRIAVAIDNNLRRVAFENEEKMKSTAIANGDKISNEECSASIDPPYSDPPYIETIAFHVGKWLKNGSAEK